MANPEHLTPNTERNAEIQRAAEQQSERLKNIETTGEKLDDSEARANVERKKVEAILSKETPAHERKSAGEPSGPPPLRQATRKQKEDSFHETMEHIQSEMSSTERTVSKIIHNPAVEKTSEVVGSTIARPNAILAGSISAFVLVGAVYFIARTIGYELSGFETIGAFIIGWVLGIVFDFLRTMITGKQTV